MKKQFAFYILHFAICIILLASFSACNQKESSSAISPDDMQVTFKALEAPVSGMWATLKISGMSGTNSDGSYPMTVNGDGSVTATITSVSEGNHTFTITYYDPSGLIIAQATTSGNVSAGSNTTISVSSSQLNTSFDEDADGYTNLVEINAGSNPKDPASTPTTQSTFDIWTATGAMNLARYWSPSILLPDGKVLVVGGGTNPQQDGGGDYYSSAELYDPILGTFSYTSNSMNNQRGWHFTGENHGATLLSNGNVLIAGGFDDTNGSTQAGGFVTYSSAELYNPSTGTFSYTGSMPQASGHHSAILLQNGKVLIAAFVTAIYDPSNGTFSSTGAMIIPRMFQTATLLPNGKVLITGGHNGSSSLLNTAELFDPATGIFSQTTGMMNSPRWHHTATLLPDGRVLIAGGNSDASLVDASILNSAEIYNPSTGTFSLAGTMNYPRQGHTATLLLNGKVLIAGGYGGTNVDTTASELYDPSTGQFTIGSKTIVSRAYHFATLLSNGSVLVSGGNQRSAELYIPSPPSDSTSPLSPSITINNGDATTSSGDVTLTLSATDNTGIVGYYAAESPTIPLSVLSTWMPVVSAANYSGTVPFTLSPGSGVKTVYVWFKDVAGNLSSVVSDSINLQ